MLSKSYNLMDAKDTGPAKLFIKQRIAEKMKYSDRHKNLVIKPLGYAVDTDIHHVSQAALGNVDG
jgi:hypothetical protein